ncbi:MAG TPA: vgr related protein [Allosphingosinicella sp.]|jgi:hypothetical protein
MSHRHLTPGEIALAAGVFGSGIRYDRVRIHRGKWFPFQPRNVAMAPRGHIHFHPRGELWSDDFSLLRPHLQGLFIHEMTHVWQAQTRGSWYLVLMRHPFCRYHYTIKPGWPLARYGLEQQAEIVRHAFLQREGVTVAGAPPLNQYQSILPFGTTAPFR